MVCTYCGHETQVTNSRPQKRTNSIWRRRKCLECGALFTSTEQLDLATSLQVRRTMTRRLALEPFDRTRLLVSIYDSVRHRPHATTDASALLNTIVASLAPFITQAVIDREHIIAVASTVLEKFDHVAATHYQAFHK